MPILLGLLAGLAILVVLLGLWIPGTGPDPIRARLSRFAERQRTLTEIELEQPFVDRILRPIIGRIAGIVVRFLPRQKGKAGGDRGLGGLQKRLAMAGNPGNLGASDFLGVLGVCTVGMAGLVFVLIGLAGAGVPTALLLGTIGGIVGYLIPTMWLGSKVRARKKEIQKAMPDSLDLLVIGVEAGLGFDAAVQRLTEKADHALAKEFKRMLAEVRMGRSRREALKDMVERTDVADLNTFVAAIIQADQLGVSVTRVLSLQADQMRMLRRQRAEETANKAPLKMLFPMIFLIFPAMFIVILGPSVPTIMETGLFGK